MKITSLGNGLLVTLGHCTIVNKVCFGTWIMHPFLLLLTPKFPSYSLFMSSSGTVQDVAWWEEEQE